MSYDPAQTPTDINQMVAFLDNELQKLKSAINFKDFLPLSISNVAPTKPQDGIYYADGTNWNPGSGKGFYYYKDAAYYKLLDVPAAGVYDDYLVSGLAINATGPNAPTLTNFRSTLYLYAFLGTGVTVHQAFFTIHILHDIKPGEDLTLHIHWAHTNASPTGNVKWYVDYSIANGYGNEVFPTVTTLSTTQAAGAQYSHHITNDDDMVISAAELEPDAVIIGRIYRDPADVADTFASSAFLIQIDGHHLVDRIGTAERNRPFDGY